MDSSTVIWITAQDYQRLNHLLAELALRPDVSQDRLDVLEEILDMADVVRPEKVPANVVTMNSWVQFQNVQTQVKTAVAIVYPDDADPASNRISVLSPVGAALIGQSDGAEIELRLPRDQRMRVRITNVLYQPEAHGEYAL